VNLVEKLSDEEANGNDIRESNGHVTDDVTWTLKGQCLDSINAQSQKQSEMLFSNNRITTLVCCAAVRSATLATAWLLVHKAHIISSGYKSW